VPAAYASLMQGPLSASVARLAEDGAGDLKGEELVRAIRRLATMGALDLMSNHSSKATRQ